MANIFISYNRQSEVIVADLADDIETLNHTAWFDQELSGGQVWWDQILSRIRNCDLFVFVLTSESLQSTACNREYNYANELGKPILPILVSDGVSINLLPSALSQIQCIDYRKQDRSAALSLARALSNIPVSIPLPNPLPTPPEVPISYLGDLTSQVEATSTLTYEEQSRILVELKRSLRESETKNDALTLLQRLRKRRDLLAVIAEEIDELLKTNRQKSPVDPSSPINQKIQRVFVKTPQKINHKSPNVQYQDNIAESVASKTTSKITRRSRVRGASIGAFFGTIFGILVMMFIYPRDWVFGFIPGIGGAISGAIIGTRLRLLVVVLFGATLGFLIAQAIYSNFASSAIFGAPTGAILGAVLVLILRK